MLIAGAIAFKARREAPTATTRPAAIATTSTAAPTTSTTSPTQHTIATAKVPSVAVFDDPSAPAPSQTFQHPWFVNDDPHASVPLVFLVEQQRADGWIQVLLPVRPNGSTGWIRAESVVLTPTPYRLTVALGAHHLVVYADASVVLEDTVAVGAEATPTPTGHFYIRALLQAPNPHTAYGPFAYGLSGYSETLQEFAGGDAEVGIHGNNDPSALGHDVSHGCIRMSNDAITTLTKLLPLGTPVDISA
jgi:lipoprotein-anchoring transpeptidase ErfK/SrfK